MNCDLGSEKEIIVTLEKIEGVKEVHGTLGMYDIIAQIESENEDKIREIITTATIRPLVISPKMYKLSGHICSSDRLS